MGKSWIGAWAKLVVFGAVGLSLIAIAEAFIPHHHPVWQEVVKHLGTAALIATVVAALFHISEIKEHLAEFTRMVLVDSAFLATLSTKRLLELRRQIASVMLRQVVTNDRFDHAKIDEQFEKLLFGELLLSEGRTGGQYRENYTETIELRFLTGAQLAEEIAGASQPDAMEAIQIYVEMTTITSYDLVSPRTGVGFKQDMPFEGNLTKITFLKPEQQIRYELGTAEHTRARMDLELPTGKPNLLTFKCNTTLDVPTNGVLHVCSKVVEIEQAGDSPFMLKQMSMLTHAPLLKVSANVPANLLGELMLGLGNHLRRNEGNHSFELAYSGWMAEFHGYVIWWLPQEVRASASKYM